MRLLTKDKFDEILQSERWFMGDDELTRMLKKINDFMSAPGVYQMPESALTRGSDNPKDIREDQ